MPSASPAITKLAEALAALLAEAAPPPLVPNQRPTPPSWRERLWTAPLDCRIGVVELAEALGRSKAFCYRLTRLKEVPFRRLDGQLLFRVGDIRDWLKQREDVVVRPVH